MDSINKNSNIKYFRKELIYRLEKVADKNQLLNIVSNDLYQKGFVKTNFLDNIIKRETDFPTGLPGKVNIAIPHTYPECINREFIAVVLLDDPVKFTQMATQNKELDVSVIFILGYKFGDHQVKLLQILIDEFVLGKGADELLRIKSDEDVVQWLEKNVERKLA